MSHLLQSTNPDAAARANGGARPMPQVGEVVRYHPRPSEVRRTRVTVPGIVLAVDEGNRQLELMIIHASDDTLTQDRVPEHVEGDRGWSRMPGADAGRVEALEAEVDLLKSMIEAITANVVGDFVVPEGECVMSLISNLDERIGTVEDAANGVGSIPPATVKAPQNGRSKRRAARA